MQIVAVSAPGGEVLATLDVGHGQDPRRLLWARGLVLSQWLSARATDDLVTLTAVARPRRGEDYPPSVRHRGRDLDLSADEAVDPVVKQRLACYAVCLSERGLLATRFSKKVAGTASPGGAWGLPGGGRESGEQPGETVIREVQEETGQIIGLDRILTVVSDHWVGRSPAGVVEDFHALRLIYLAHCDAPTEPEVHDIGGTTAAAAWLPGDRWQHTAWTTGFRQILQTVSAQIGLPPAK